MRFLSLSMLVLVGCQQSLPPAVPKATPTSFVSTAPVIAVAQATYGAPVTLGSPPSAWQVTFEGNTFLCVGGPHTCPSGGAHVWVPSGPLDFADPDPRRCSQCGMKHPGMWTWTALPSSPRQKSVVLHDEWGKSPYLEFSVINGPYVVREFSTGPLPPADYSGPSVTLTQVP